MLQKFLNIFFYRKRKKKHHYSRYLKIYDDAQKFPLTFLY